MTEDYEQVRDEALAQVHHLPVRQAGGELETAGDVLEGEVVSDADYAEVQRRKAIERYRGYSQTPVVVYRATKTVVTHDHTRYIARSTLRQGLTVVQGLESWAKRGWDAGTMGVYRRQIRLAESAGDRESLAEWIDRKEHAAERRHKRLMDAPKLAAGIAKVLVGSLAALVVLVLVAGLVLQLSGHGSFVDTVLSALDVARWIVTAIAVAWTPLLISAPFLLVLAAWREGKRRGTPPLWLMTDAERASDAEFITPSIVVKALRDLGMADLRKRIDEMEDGGAGMLSTITIAGRGVEVSVLLPSGVSTADIQKRRRRLAENMTRHEHELFITIPKQARTVTLWIADPGGLDEPIEPSPLVTDAPKRVSMFRDRAPWGQNLRSDPVGLNLWQKHLLITGLSNMGKTASLRALALWLAFDPTAEFRIADLKGLGDWRMFRGMAKTLIEGPSDEDVMEAAEMLEGGVAEMERRLKNFDSDKYPDGVPPGLAGYHPIVLIVDEAQVAFMCPAIGEDKRPYGGTKATSRYFMAARKIHNQGRAVNVLLWQGTQDPTDQNLPKLVREGAHIRASLNVGTEAQSRMALGENAVNDGAAPHELRQEHKGTVVVTGMGVPTQQGQTSETVRTHFIGGTEATAVAEQAKELRRHKVVVEHEERDLLADVLAVARDEDAPRASDVARRLRELAPTYKPYVDLTGEALSTQLEDLNVKRGGKGGVPLVRTERVRAARALREVTDDED